MWPFTKPAKKADVTALELRAEFAECKASVRALELEWERTYSKLRGIVARMSRKDGNIGEPDVTPATTSPGNPLPATESPLLGAGRFPRRNY